MKSRIPLTSAQCHEVSAKITAAYKAGLKDGRKQELFFTLFELNNRYGLTRDKLISILEEIGELAA